MTKKKKKKEKKEEEEKDLRWLKCKSRSKGQEASTGTQEGTVRTWLIQSCHCWKYDESRDSLMLKHSTALTILMFISTFEGVHVFRKGGRGGRIACQYARTCQYYRKYITLMHVHEKMGARQPWSKRYTCVRRGVGRTPSGARIWVHMRVCACSCRFTDFIKKRAFEAVSWVALRYAKNSDEEPKEDQMEMCSCYK